MKWPVFGPRPEVRTATDYTSLHLDAAWRAATGAHRRAVAAVAGCAVRWATAASQFAVEPGTRGLAPVLYQIGARLATAGEALFTIHVLGGRVELRPVADWDVRGPADPSAWRYRVSESGPTTMTHRVVPADEVLHVRWNPDPRMPWRGRMPLADAGDTLRALGAVERSIGDEASMHVARLLSPPVTREHMHAPYWPPSTSLSLDHFRATFNDLLAGTPPADVVVLPEAAESIRLGAEFSAQTSEVRESIERSVYRAYGVPALLFDERAPGAAYREAYRDFRITTLAALAGAIEDEARRKLHPSCTVSTAPLKASDVAAQARAVHVLTEAGMPLADAREAVGI